MSASEKDLNNLNHAHSGPNPTRHRVVRGGPVANHDLSGVTYYSHPQSQAPVTLQHTPQSNTHPGPSHPVPPATGKPQSHGQKPASSQKSQAGASSMSQKPKQPLSRLAPNQPPTTIQPSATTNAPNVAPPKSAPTPTPPGSSAVMAAVMAQAQAAAGQAVAAQQAKQQAPAAPTPTPQGTSQSPTHPAQGQPVPPPYPYPYPYYMPPGQPGAPPYIYPGAPGAPGFLPTGTPAQGGAPPPGYPYMYPMYPAPIPVPQTSPVQSAKEKKSQRTYQACQKCRQWKAKCNGLKPCNHCQKRGVPCEYAERRNMSGPSESSPPEQGASQEDGAPASPEVASSSKDVDPKATVVGEGSTSVAQPHPNLAAAVEPPQPQTQQPQVQAQAQAPPPVASPPHPGQPPQHPHPMAMYPPPPGYAYPPQMYPGMPYPAPGPDPNAPYAHFVGMQYPQPYGPYLWGPPPPPPGHEQGAIMNPGDGEDGERDADGKLKIKRTFQACQKCRQRKAKCNGARPSCQHCTTRGLACEYAKERSKPRANGEEGDESQDGHSPEVPSTMDPSQAMASPMHPNPQASPGAPGMPPAAPPNMFQPPFAYDPNAYNPHVDPHQHAAQPIYPFPPYAYGPPPGFGTIAGPPLVHIGEEGTVATYHPAVTPTVVTPGPLQPSATTPGPSKRPRTIRPPGTPGSGKIRIFQACERCRERKAKCDGVRPVCTHCAARELNCEWAGKRRMRGPAKGITPRRSRNEGNFVTNVNAGMAGIPIGLNTAGLQTIEQHNTSTGAARKRKRRASHSSGSPSPSESSSSSSSSPSESDDDDRSGMGVGPDGMGAVAGQW
ncbi:hypothetical protein BDV93DRAFT_601348 [Ceratobasidium sp. AG-I]|nr:hypothetical protein BDV93DRAFT_601348 [Ceratobasidium sp. AG-I]